jgi:hypothetical protein
MKSKSTNTAKLLGSLAFVILVLSVSLWLWTRPNGVGEYDQSPDGRWTAHVSSMSHGTLSGRRRTYVEMRIVDSATGVTVARQEFQHSLTDQVPAYGDRSQTFIQWATNSSAFTVAITNGSSVTLAVPRQPRQH